MKTLIVSSTRPYSGKSGVCVALLGILGQRGVRAGYFKPFGTMPVTVDGTLTDADAVYAVKYTTAPAALPYVCPVVETREFTEDVLRHEDTSRVTVVRDAFEQVSLNADVMVVEGPSDLAQGRTVGLNLCALAEQLSAAVLLVDTPSGRDLPDHVLWAADCLGDRLHGVVFNGVREQLAPFLEREVSPFLERHGLPVLGILQHDAVLSSVSVAEIAEALAGTVLTAEDHLDELVETFMVGAMGQDKALRFFRRKTHKAVITGGDRADVQLAALETDTRCIVLTGGLAPSSLVLSRAQELGVPMILVDADTLTAVEAMERLLGHVRLHDPAKAARMRDIVESNVDVDRLMASAFGLTTKP